VITGAGRGLGEAYADQIAAAGGNVVVNDIDAELAERTADRIREQGGKAVASGHDVADPEQAEELIALCVQQFARIDGLVNNAGLNYATMPWEDSFEQMRELMETNVFGVFNCGVAAMRAMHESATAGSIVNIASGALFGQRRLAAYAASKGAVASMTFSWALDVEELGIRVNAVCPLAYTRMMWSGENGQPVRPSGPDPASIAPLVVFLLSDRAEGITGQLIRCNGEDMHIVGQPYFKQPILSRDSWDTDSVERAFDGVFQAHLEPFGLEKRMPQRLQDLITPPRSA
jgi:NAD(P)-dependent dehydrogenase (short-subunit alcohol dehydrogenase family)